MPRPGNLHVHYEQSKARVNARPFQWKAEWRDIVDGLLEIENVFQPDAMLRWISFETRPGF